MKEQQDSTDKDEKLKEENKKLKQILEETRDLCLEYIQKLEKNPKKAEEEVSKIAIEKMKVEDELRSAVLEKNMLRDSERILLNTFDTLKMHYDAKKNMNDSKSSTEQETQRKPEEQFQCGKCSYKTDNEVSLNTHIVNAHDAGPSQYENAYYKKRRETVQCEECDYRTPFVANLGIHKEQVHGENTWQFQGRGRQEGRSKAQFKVYNYQERKANGFCRSWNRGHCHFDQNCKFLHEDAPECYYGDRCSRKTVCRYFHADLFHQAQDSFLGQGQQFQGQSNQYQFRKQ